MQMPLLTELANFICECFYKDVAPTALKNELTNLRRKPRVEKLERLVKFKPQTPLREIIRLTVN